VYVEYTGTALTAILKRPPVSDPDSAFRAVRTEYLERFELEWFAPLGFENTFAMLVRRSTADSLALRTLTDAATHSDGWVAGFGSEFMERADGFPGLSEAYGFKLRSPPRVMDLGLLYRALASAEIDLTAGNSTDGRIEALDLVMLRDNMRYFPPYEGALVARRAALDRNAALRPALEMLSGKIDTDEMRRLNRAVDVEGRDYREVARAWVERTLVEAG
jgi:glycine betaine/choline ABC-type transport system substrate-binding protein